MSTRSEELLQKTPLASNFSTIAVCSLMPNCPANGEVPLVQDILYCDLSFVVGYEVLKGDSCLKADERSRQVEQDEAFGAIIAGKTGSAARFIKAVPRATGRIDLVGLKLPLVLKVLAVLVDEVPGDLRNIFLAPLKPILYTGLHVKDGPAVKLSWVHVSDLVLGTMLATVDGSEDEGVLVEVVTVELPAVGQLKDTLTHLDGRHGQPRRGRGPRGSHTRS